MWGQSSVWGLQGKCGRSRHGSKLVCMSVIAFPKNRGNLAQLSRPLSWGCLGSGILGLGIFAVVGDTVAALQWENPPVLPFPAHGAVACHNPYPSCAFLPFV